MTIVYILGHERAIYPLYNYRCWDKRRDPLLPFVSELSGWELLDLLKSGGAKFEKQAATMRDRHTTHETAPAG